MIKGFRGTSLVDFPGHLAAVIFLGGCNFRCPFCYNVDLVIPERLKRLPSLDLKEILEELKRREGFISGVVITGGEPTLQGRFLRHLLELIRAETNLLIKLDTNGSQPEIVRSLGEAGLLDYVALDLKTSPKRYQELGGSFEPVAQTIDYLSQKAFSFEMRITAVPYYVSYEDLEEMIPYLLRAPLVAIQRFMNEYERLKPEAELGVYGPEKLKEMKKFLSTHLPGKVILRNV